MHLEDGYSARNLMVDRSEAEVTPGFSLSFQIIEIWEELCAQGNARRRLLDPLRFGPKLLPHIVLINVLGAGQDYQWRLFGGAHVAEYGINLTGVRLSDVLRQDPSGYEVRLIFDRCYNTAEPTFYDIRYQSTLQTPRACRGVLLPLFAETGTQVAHILGCAEWHDVD